LSEIARKTPQVERSLPGHRKIYPVRRSRTLDGLTLVSGVSGNVNRWKRPGRIYLAELARYKNVTLNATAKQKRLSSEEIQKIQELKEEGKTQREIAEEIGVSQSAVNQNIRSDKCQNLSTPDSPTPTTLEPDDADEALPISRKRQMSDSRPHPRTFGTFRGPKKAASRSGYHYIRYIPLQPGRI